SGWRLGQIAFWPGDVPAGKHLEIAGSQAPLDVQPTEGGTWIRFSEADPYSARPISITDGALPEAANEFHASKNQLENAKLRVELNDDGDITRIYEKTMALDLLPEGALANQWLAFEDRPINSDAWDIDIFYEDHVWTSDPAT